MTTAHHPEDGTVPGDGLVPEALFLTGPIVDGARLGALAVPREDPRHFRGIQQTAFVRVRGLERRQHLLLDAGVVRRVQRRAAALHLVGIRLLVLPARSKAPAERRPHPGVRLLAHDGRTSGLWPAHGTPSVVCRSLSLSCVRIRTQGCGGAPLPARPATAVRSRRAGPSRIREEDGRWCSVDSAGGKSNGAEHLRTARNAERGAGSARCERERVRAYGSGTSVGVRTQCRGGAAHGRAGADPRVRA